MSNRARPLGLLLGIALAFGAIGCSFLRPALPPGLQACVEVPQATCAEILEGRVNNRAPVALTAYRITCKSATCTDAAGEAEVELAWADGQTETSSYTWAG